MHWSLDHGSHLHARYQQMLATLARRGVMLGIVSKNDERVAQVALARDDLLLSPSSFFPVMVSWGPKSAAVSAVLSTWNIAASDVVFVDDSPAELAEVARTRQEVTCLRFPTNSANELEALLTEVNRLFWTCESQTLEDELRVESLRRRVDLVDAANTATDHASFVASLDGVLSIDTGRGWTSERAIQLVNKTNQFNIAGTRFTREQWIALNERENAVHLTVAYADKYAGDWGRSLSSAACTGTACSSSTSGCSVAEPSHAG